MKNKDNNHIFRLIYDLKQYKKSISLTLFCTFISKIFLITCPVIAGVITDIFSKALNSGNFNNDKIFLLCLILALCFMFGYIFDICVRRNSVIISQKLLFYIREKASLKLNKLPVNFIESKSAGEIISKITVDIQTIGAGIEAFLTGTIGEIIMILGIIAIMFIIHPILALIYFAIIPEELFVILLLSKKSKELYNKRQIVQSELIATVSDIITNYPVIKSFESKQTAVNKFNEKNIAYQNSFINAMVFNGLQIPLSCIINNLSFIVLCVAGGYMLIKGSLSIGMFTSFLFFGNLINAPLSSIASTLNTIMSSLACTDRVYDFLNEKEEIEDINKKELDKNNLKGDIEFCNVNFKYNKSSKNVLNNVSFKIPAGKTTAIVGASGAGKTTLINLILRFYEINNGEIKIDGNNIADYSKSNLRSLIGMIQQDTFIFNGTIADNIKYAKLNATQEEIEIAAKKAMCHEFILNLENGYQTYLNSDILKLSQGECQLIAIARIMLLNPQIIILDEATSNIDSKTENLLSEAISELTRNRTCIIIAHKLYTIKNADIILKVENGNVYNE